MLKRTDMRNLIIYGVGSQAEVAYSYFQIDSDYRVIAFTVEQSHIKEITFQGLPLIPFEEIENYFGPDEADMFIAIGPIKLGSVLENYCNLAKLKGYSLASYFPSSEKKYFTPRYGENCFFDHVAHFHPFVKIGNGVTVMNSEVAHHAEIGNFSFLTSAMIGGNVIIEDYVFIGMKSVIKEGVQIGRGSIIGMGAIIVKDVAPYSVYSVPGTKVREGLDSRRIEIFHTRKTPNTI
jgi:carbonic anhydrase/acetyltransferase-like protein (isoleucine patch superfamily)